MISARQTQIYRAEYAAHRAAFVPPSGGIHVRRPWVGVSKRRPQPRFRTPKGRISSRACPCISLSDLSRQLVRASCLGDLSRRRFTGDGRFTEDGSKRRRDLSRRRRSRRRKPQARRAETEATGFRCISSGTTLSACIDILPFIGICKALKLHFYFPKERNEISELHNGSTAADAAVTSRPCGPSGSAKATPRQAMKTRKA